MFSVIIPLYNKVKYIEKAIQSIINQTFKDWELIVVDDGSTDGSLEIVQKFSIFNFQFSILQQANSGVSTARNNGVKAAKYDYIVFLDADDWWAEKYLETMARLITDFPDAALWASSYFKVKNGKNISAKIGVPQGFTRGYFDYIDAYTKSLYMPVTSITAVVRKEIFEKTGGFKPHLKLGEDFDFWLRVALENKMALENKPLAFYNQDVEVQNRAVGKRLHKTENHFLFHLQHFAQAEKNNVALKQMLDNLRVFALFPYFLNKETRLQAKAELARIDWSRQPKTKYKLYYKTPVCYLKIRQNFQVFASNVKQKLIKSARYIISVQKPTQKVIKNK